MKLADDARLASQISDLSELYIRWGKLWWQFWEQEERAYATIYGEYLQQLVKQGEVKDLNEFMLSLAEDTHPANLRLLKNLRAIRKNEEYP